MYARQSDRVEDDRAALDVLDHAALAHLVSNSSSGFEVSSLPIIVDRAAGQLVGHLARANAHWKRLDGQPVVLIAVASNSYVSPSWYASKAATGGRVVPTWNYEAVHVHGVARTHDDPAWISDVVDRLTEHHEAQRTDGGERWATSDAPAAFLARQVRAIIGVSVAIERIDAKRKLSANRSADDRAGVVRGLSATSGAPQRMIDAMTAALDRPGDAGDAGA
ncbi:MAG: FMN-binding negative transcriptional regulator [Actinomycetota bacterium]